MFAWNQNRADCFRSTKAVAAAPPQGHFVLIQRRIKADDFSGLSTSLQRWTGAVWLHSGVLPLNAKHVHSDAQVLSSRASPCAP